MSVLVSLLPAFAATIVPSTLLWDHTRNFTLTPDWGYLISGQHVFYVYNQTGGGDVYFPGSFSCDGSQCTGNMPLDVNAAVPSQGCIAPQEEYNHPYSPPLDGKYTSDAQAPTHPWYHSHCTPFQIAAVWIANPTPSSAQAGTFPVIQFESNAPENVELRFGYNNWGDTVTDARPDSLAICDSDYTKTTHTCTVNDPTDPMVFFLPDRATNGTTLSITPAHSLGTGELDVLITGNSFLRYPWSFAWGENHPTKVQRGAGLQFYVETDTYLEVSDLPTQVLFADASGTYISGYDGGGLCQPGSTGAYPPYCMVWVHDIPANAAWGCIRRMAPGEQMAGTDPATAALRLADAASCPRFAVVDYALPKFESMTPTLVQAGSDGFVLTINGEWNDDIKWWNYIDVDNWTWWSDIPDFVSLTPTQMKIRIPASLVGPVGSTHTVTLWTLYSDTPSQTYEVVAQAPAALTSGIPEQNGNTVIVPIDWTQPVSTSSIDCGTSPTQRSAAVPANCAYSAPGTYTVTGTADGNSADPITVTIGSLGLQPESLTASILGQSRSTFTTYSSPVPVDLAAAFILADGIGIPDALDTNASSVNILRAEGGTSSASFTTRTGLTYGGRVYLGPGTYTLSLNGQSRLGRALSASTTLTITQATAELNTQSMAQAGQSVQLPVAWPTDESLSNQVVDCGTGSPQTFSGTSGTCTYSRAGTYTVQGRFTDALGVGGIRTAPVSVTVSSVSPGPAVLRAAPASGTTPTHDLSAAVPVASYGAPAVYPVPVAFRLTFDPPSGGQVGIPDDLDATRSHLYVKPVASAADLTAPIGASDQGLSLQDNGDGSFSSTTGLGSFAVNSSDPSTWEQRIVLQGQTLTGTPVSAELRLQGPRGDANQIQYSQQRIDPIYPYPPTVYRYVTSGLHGPITGEPMTQAWSSSEGQNRSVVGDGYVDITFTTAGSKSVTLSAAGPLTGPKTAVDASIVIPPAPAAAIAFTTTVPTYNRPPATYRFAPNYPPLLPGERLVGNPVWSVADHSTPMTLLGQFTGSPFYFTFTAASSYDVVVSQQTTARTLYGRSMVTVNPDLPPAGSIDCGGSYIAKTTSPWTYVLSCKAVNAMDPDGSIKSYIWGLPDLGYSVAGTTTWHYTFSTPQVVNVSLTLIDNSYATCAPCGRTVLQTSFDLRTLR